MPDQTTLQPDIGRTGDPIFLLGMTERTGTNFLFHLLCLHPSCDYGGPIWENYIIPHIEMLARFAKTVYEDYSPQWQVPSLVGDEDVLLADIGRGLIRYLNRQLGNGKAMDDGAGAPDQRANAAPRRLVTKTPSVKNLPLFNAVFPGSKLLVLVRDGRSVAESMVKTFDVGYEEAIHTWTSAARTVNAFVQSQSGRGPPSYLLVRYEDLVGETEKTLRTIFDYLGLDADIYDYEAAARAPVIGSSETKFSGAVHWKHLDRPKDFDPLRRWAAWSPAQLDRFAHLAAAESIRLGYPVQPAADGAHSVGNRLRDLAWRLRRGL